MARRALFLGLCSRVVGQGDLAEGENPVIEVYMYRAMAYDGNVPYANANVNMGDLQGVTQYVHREVIADHTIHEAATRTARKYDISHILRWRFLVKNPIGMAELDEFVTFDYGQATNTAHWDKFQQNADFVGQQVQTDTFVRFRDPYYWFSVSGDCPSLPYAANVVTSKCAPPDDACSSKNFPEDGCLPSPGRSFSGTPHQCICDSNDTRVSGGLCNPGPNGGPPEAIQVPTGLPGCVYSYNPEPDVVSWDEIAGISESSVSGAPPTPQQCNDGDGERDCRDWSDFRLNCVDESLKRTFNQNGDIVQVSYCVEYDLHPACMQAPVGSSEGQGCDHPDCAAMSDVDRELGLPFWNGRCNDVENRKRAEKLADAFGVEDATATHHLLPPPTEEYSDVGCKHISTCFGNKVHGESFCSRAWGGVCTICRIPGPQNPSANRDIGFCPWNLGSTGDYHDDLMSGDHCRTNDPNTICCLYSNTCRVPYNDLDNPAHLRDGELNANTGPDMLAFAMAAQDRTPSSDVVSDLMLRVAKELLDITQEQIDSSEPRLATFAYWSWGQSPPREWVAEQWGDPGAIPGGNWANLNFGLVLQELRQLFPLPTTTLPPTTPAPAPGPTPAPSPPQFHAEIVVELTEKPVTDAPAGTHNTENTDEVLQEAVSFYIRHESPAVSVYGCTAEVAVAPLASALSLVLRRLQDEATSTRWIISADFGCGGEDVSGLLPTFEDAELWHLGLNSQSQLADSYNVTVASAAVEVCSPSCTPGPSPAPPPSSSGTSTPLVICGLVVIIVGVGAIMGGWFSGPQEEQRAPRASTVEMSQS